MAWRLLLVLIQAASVAGFSGGHQDVAGSSQLIRRETLDFERATSGSIAICKTGLQRNLLAKPVISTYFKHLVNPLKKAGYRVDTYLSIRNASSPADVMRSAYDAADVRLLNMSSPTALPGIPIIQQFVTIQDCYKQIEQAEAKRGEKYAWIFKVRSDHVFLSDAPELSKLSTQNVYVPWSGSMAGDPKYKCNNDHAFFCPRDLCRPYFSLPELWTSEFSHSRDAANDVAQQEVPNGLRPPEKPFVLPEAPLQETWFFFARYGGSHLCAKDEDAANCCGKIREVNWFYTLSRDPVPCSSCEMACGYTLDECWQVEKNESTCHHLRQSCDEMKAAFQKSSECTNHLCEGRGRS